MCFEQELREGDSCAVLVWADLISHESRPSRAGGAQPSVWGVVGLGRGGRKSLQRNAAVGGEGAVAGGAGGGGGPVADPPLLQEPCRGQTSGQPSFPEDGSS